MKIALTLFALLSATSAFAGSLSEGRSLIRCEQGNGGFAIQAPSEDAPARAWLTEGALDQVGLELSVVEAQVARCPYCYFIQAETSLLGQAVRYDFAMNSKYEGGKFQPSLRVQLNGAELGEFSCSQQK